MGKNYQGINGNFSGKIGPTVGRQKNGRTITAVYQPLVANPKTTRQVANRNKFTYYVQFLQPLAGWAKMMCKGDTKYGTGWSNLIKMVMASDSWGGTPQAPEILVNKIVISKGSVPVFISPSAVIDSSSVNISWTDNSGEGTALASDVCCIAVINTAKRTAVYSTNAGQRSDRQGSLMLPTSWSGDSVDVFASFRKEDTSEQSNSVYLGNFAV